MERKNYTIAVDLGSSNVTVAVGEELENGLLDVVYVVRKPAEGVNAGQIENSQLAGEAIHAAIGEVESALGCRITEVYAGISGEFVRCACCTDHVYVSNPHDGVSQSDVDSLFSRMRNVQAPEGETIMERIPQRYIIDGTQEVRNPVGSFGTTLSAEFNFVLCSTTPLQRLEMVLKRRGIAIKGVFPTVLATPEGVLSPEEKSEGVAVVDIGGGVTDVTVYYRNVARYVATIPMGASAINQDIRTIGVPEKYIEQLKIEKGSAVAELAPNTLVKVPGRTPKEEKGILKQNLASVIESRAMDIAEYVLQEIQDSKFAAKLAYGIVLTGGSALLKDLDKLFNRVTKMEVRVAAPDQGITEESFARLDSPAYATVTGLLLRGARRGPSSLIVEHPPKRPGDIPEEEPAAAAEPAGVAPAPEPAPAVQEPPKPVVPFGQEEEQKLPDPDSFRHVPPKQPEAPVAPAPTPAPTPVPPALDPVPEPEPEPIVEPDPVEEPDEEPVNEPPKPPTPPSGGRKKRSFLGGIFNKLNNGWDKGSAGDLDDDVEL